MKLSEDDNNNAEESNLRVFASSNFSSNSDDIVVNGKRSLSFIMIFAEVAPVPIISHNQKLNLLTRTLYTYDKSHHKVIRL